MPSLKRNVKNAPDSTGFESYDGQNPPMQNKMYRGKIEVARVREAATGTIGINLLVKFEAKKGDKENAKYDGYPAWVDLWLADKEPNQAREKNLYRALGVPDSKLEDVNVVHNDIDDGGEIKKVSGRNPIGRVVMIDMKVDRYEGENRLKGDAIYPVKDQSSKSVAEEPEEEPDDEDDLIEPDEDGDVDYEEREEELKGMALGALRKLASGDYDIETKGVKKDVLVTEILTQEYPDNGEEEPEDEEDDEKVSAEDLRGMTLSKVKAFAKENADYTDADLKGEKKADIIDLLIEDEIIESDEPPF
jgi:hypothetical protein